MLGPFGDGPRSESPPTWSEVNHHNHEHDSPPVLCHMTIVYESSTTLMGESWKIIFGQISFLLDDKTGFEIPNYLKFTCQVKTIQIL